LNFFHDSLKYIFEPILS